MKSAGNYGYVLHAQRHEDQGHADDHVDHEMIGGGDHRQGHRRRHQHCEHAQCPVVCGAKDDDPDGEVPAGVKARHRGVLIHERRREDLPVARGALRDGVNQRQAGQPRRRHREQREDE